MVTRNFYKLLVCKGRSVKDVNNDNITTTTIPILTSITPINNLSFTGSSEWCTYVGYNEREIDENTTSIFPINEITNRNSWSTHTDYTDNGILSNTVTLTNNTSETIKINEIGSLFPGYLQTGYRKTVLVSIEKIDEINLLPGETVVLNHTIKF